MNLQELVDELSLALGRSVVIGDREFRPLAASPQGDDIDDIRTNSLLRRALAPEPRKYLESEGVLQATKPVIVSFAPFGTHARLVVPIRDDGTLLAMMSIIVGGLPALTEAQHAAIDASVMLARHLLAENPRAATSLRAAVMGRLISADAVERRAAFTEALRKNWLERGRNTVVRAVAVDPGVGPIQRVAFGRHVGALSGPNIGFLGDRDGKLLFVGRAADNDVADRIIPAEASKLAVAIHSIGSAHHSRDHDDLGAAADQAALAADLAGAIKPGVTRADISELGAWTMLAAIQADRSQLETFSPAAHALTVGGGDPLQRETVETYLDVGGRARDACELLHIHRTTLYYRLDNMPAPVKAALDDGISRSSLHLALKLVRYWEATGRF
jgi:hypothetical protein